MDLQKINHLIINRNDAIGDVILTLPLATIIKQHNPNCRITFIGKPYTYPIISACNTIDEVILDTDFLGNTWQPEVPIDAIIFVKPDKVIAKASKDRKIPIRIGTSHRVFHWFTANKLVNFSRRKSNLHEIELNQKLLKPFNINVLPKENLNNHYQLSPAEPTQKVLEVFETLNEKTVIIIHPKSRGSAKEWPLDNYLSLVKKGQTELPNVVFLLTGTAAEGELISKEKPDLLVAPNLLNVLGKFDLSEFMSLINLADGLLACSTGPLHIAAALGKNALGFYPSTKPQDPGRWAPIGTKAQFLIQDDQAFIQPDGKLPDSLIGISVESVLAVLSTWSK